MINVTVNMTDVCKDAVWDIIIHPLRSPHIREDLSNQFQMCSKIKIRLQYLYIKWQIRIYKVFGWQIHTCLVLLFGLGNWLSEVGEFIFCYNICISSTYFTFIIVDVKGNTIKLQAWLRSITWSGKVLLGFKSGITQ